MNLKTNGRRRTTKADAASFTVFQFRLMIFKAAVTVKMISNAIVKRIDDMPYLLCIYNLPGVL
jgi:ammonia channel protein AmtB